MLWRSEFRNVLTGYIRRNHLTLDVAIQIMEETESQMQGREYPVSSNHVLKLAYSSQCSAYDYEFVALAENLGVPLVTSDKKVLTAFPSIAIAMAGFGVP
jgi:predicted nucleic acid-binding protein